MKRVLFISLILLFGCEKSKDNNNVSNSIEGAWVQDLSVCSGKTITSQGVVNSITFSGGNYSIVNKAGGCTVTRTGTYSASGQGLSLSYSAVQCSQSGCAMTYTVNDEHKSLKCPDNISTDGGNFAVSSDATTLYMTPLVGSDTNCYHKYTRQ